MRTNWSMRWKRPTGKAPSAASSSRAEEHTSELQSRRDLHSFPTRRSSDLYIADAVKRAGSTDADKLVDALEKTDWEGTIGRIQFYGKDDQFTHSIKYGKGLITGLMLQWQDGKQISVWPKEIAKGQLKFPSFIKVTAN